MGSQRLFMGVEAVAQQRVADGQHVHAQLVRAPRAGRIQNLNAAAGGGLVSAGTVLAVVGAVAGGLLGAAAEEGLTRTQGVEITVREDDGTLRAYVQEVEPNQVFRVGERVRIMTVNGTSRVSH